MAEIIAQVGAGWGGRRRIVVGMAADLAVVTADPLALGAAELAAVRAAATVVGGRLVWRDGVLGGTVLWGCQRAGIIHGELAPNYHCAGKAVG